MRLEKMVICRVLCDTQNANEAKRESLQNNGETKYDKWSRAGVLNWWVMIPSGVVKPLQGDYKLC